MATSQFSPRLIGSVGKVLRKWVKLNPMLVYSDIWNATYMSFHRCAFVDGTGDRTIWGNEHHKIHMRMASHPYALSEAKILKIFTYFIFLVKKFSGKKIKSISYLLTCTVKLDEFEKLRPQYEQRCLATISRSSIGTWTRICDLKWINCDRIDIGIFKAHIHQPDKVILSMSYSKSDCLGVRTLFYTYFRLSVRLKRFLHISQVNRFGRGKWLDLCASSWSRR